MKDVRFIYDTELVGLGSTIFRGLHRLYYKNPDDVLYLQFVNNLYSPNNKNTWNSYLHQPFESDRKFIEEKYSQGDIIEDHGFRDGNKLLFSYGSEQNNGVEFKDIEKVSHYRDFSRPYLKFRAKILDKANDYYNRFIKDIDTISIHCRGTDQYSVNGHAGNNKHLLNFEYIKKVVNRRNYDQIFLATDEEEILENFKREYGNKVITYSTMRCDKNNNVGLHFSNRFEEEAVKYTMGEEMIIDMLLMSKCNFSYYVRSNVSLLSLLMRNDFNYEFYDDHVNYNYLE